MILSYGSQVTTDNLLISLLQARQNSRQDLGALYKRIGPINRIHQDSAQDLPGSTQILKSSAESSKRAPMEGNLLQWPS